MRPGIVLLVVALAAGGVAYWQLGGSREEGPQPFLGYVDAETLLIAPKQTGRLVELHATEGAKVAGGDMVFALDAEDEKAAVEEATAQLARARAQLEDLRAARQRPVEVDVLEARRRQAEAALALSKADLERQERLYEQKVSSEAALDRAKMAFRRDQEALAEAGREIEAAQLPGREAEIQAAEAAVAASAAALTRAGIALSERSVLAPRGGDVLDVLYRVGEVVPAGQPVLEILPPEDILVHFYAPQAAIADLTLGETVAIACDGCPEGLTGEISFIAPEAEFTPPVIFSRQERAKLVFLLKARPKVGQGAPAAALKPGLPVEVLAK